MSSRAQLVGGSLSFDHAADIYDATRGDADHISAKLTDALQRELDAVATDQLLEIGVGTGRISRPLMERGVRVTGVDIAPRMLAKLREQLGPHHTPPDLLIADATALPFASRAFRAALTVHVLHLVSDWRAALTEIRRVVAPGGVFIHHFTRFHGDNPFDASRRKQEELLAARGFTLRRRTPTEEINDVLRAAGAALRTEVYAEEDERTPPSAFVERARNRIDSWSWEIPDDIYPGFFAAYEAWCREHYGDLDRKYVQRVTFELDVWSLP